MSTKKKNVECNLCNRLFSTDEKRAAHVKRYHITGTQQSQYQCDDCGKTPDQLGYHNTVHKLKKHKELQAQKAAARKAQRDVHTASQKDVEEAIVGASSAAPTNQPTDKSLKT